MSIAQITDHVARALAILPSQFADATKLRALLTALTAQVQLLDDDAWACIEDRMLDTAEGAQLDQYGKVLGQPRDGLADDDYRALLGIRILANRSNGQADAILRVVAGLLGSDRLSDGGQGVFYRTLPPGAYELWWVSDDAADPLDTGADRLALIRKILDEITPSGVSWSATDASSSAFQFTNLAGDGPVLGLDEGGLGRRV